MFPIPEIPEGHGRLILGFLNYEDLDMLFKTFKLDKAEDIEAFVMRILIESEMYYLIRVERKMAPYDVLGDLLYTMVPGRWRESARFIYRENADGSLVQVKHSGYGDPEETVKVLNALVTLNMPIFKGRMGLPYPIPSEA
jgi:hypothetical protein